MDINMLLSQCVAVAIAVAPAMALAEAATPNQGETKRASVLEEVIVTAQKSAENLQDVSSAVTAFSGQTLADRGISDVQAVVRLVPNMAFSNNYGQVRITLRGLSFQDLATQGGEARVAYHVNGAYVGMTGDIGGSFYDIERIEVNRGPQGTLFGRNAIAGTVNVVTRGPTDDFSGYLNAEVGNYQTHNFDGAISGPLGGGFSARVAFQTRNHRGYEYNVPNMVDVNNQNMQAFRGTLKYDNDGTLTATLTADYFRQDDRDGPLAIRPAVAGLVGLTEAAFGATIYDGNPRHNYSGSLQFTDKETYGVALNTNLDLGNGYTLASLTDYRSSDFLYHYTDESDLVLIDSFGGELAKQFSQELRLEKDLGRGNILLGAYFYSQDYNMDSENAALGALGGFIGFPEGSFLAEGYAQGFTLGGGAKTTAVAGFGQVTFELTDTTTLIAGARYSSEKKKKHDEFFDFNLLDPFDPNYVSTSPRGNDDVDYNEFSPRVTLEQHLSENQLIYAAFAKGFKAGGYNVGGRADPYLPESLTSYEVGFKLELLDHRLRFNGAAFYNDYDDMQVVVALITSNMNVNAASSEIYGAEFEVTANLTDGLELDAAVAVLESEFKEFDTFIPFDPAAGAVSLAGNRLPFTPDYTLSYGAQYTFNARIGEITIRGDGHTKGQTYFDQFNTKQNSEGSFTILNASIGWEDPDERMSVTAFLKNITDETVLNGTFMGGGLVGFPLNGRYDPPRTYGVRFGLKL